MRSELRALVAVDFGEDADEALRQAHAWALARRARLVALHVAPSLVGSQVLFPQLVEQGAIAQPRLEARISELLAARVAERTSRRPGEFEIVISEGTPHVEILRCADELGASWIFLGGHAAHDPGRALLGEVAAHVVRRARTSVVIARRRARSGRVLVATDFSPGALAAVRAGVEATRHADARLTLAHSIERRIDTALWMSTSFGSGFQFVRDQEVTAATETEDRLRALLARFGARGEARVLEGDPARAIALLARDLPAELVIVGATGRTGLRRALAGSVAEKVAWTAPCSVLIAR